MKSGTYCSRKEKLAKGHHCSRDHAMLQKRRIPVTTSTCYQFVCSSNHKITCSGWCSVWIGTFVIILGYIRFQKNVQVYPRSNSQEDYQLGECEGSRKDVWKTKYIQVQEDVCKSLRPITTWYKFIWHPWYVLFIIKFFYGEISQLAGIHGRHNSRNSTTIADAIPSCYSSWFAIIWSSVQHIILRKWRTKEKYIVLHKPDLRPAIVLEGKRN